ncbi:MAG: cysteine desulfurase NifS [Deltaproteobacteria bacterium]|jgi:cysteine desulfurase|nr:cysteine desulfurase NifS [Deltaproteobacteria bacterium]
MKVYADNAATTAISEAALDTMNECLRDLYGNPSSVHGVGQEAARRLEGARSSVAALLGAEPREIYFTSGGTEADNWAIRAGALLGAQKNKKHIISSRFEHHAVLHTLRLWEKQGFEITLLDVHSDGLVRPEELAAAIRDDTALVSVIYANNEIGTIQPVEEIGGICRERGVLFHTDAVQAVGHLPIDVHAQFIDMLSLSAHKFHGPKGVGAFYCRKGIPLAVFMEGGAQERGKRAGTENVPSIIGMAEALKESCAHMREDNKKVEAMRDKLTAALTRIPRSRLNGHPDLRLPGIANFCFSGIEGEGLLLLLDQNGICASSGSACTSGSLDPSHVLLAIGIPHEEAHGSLRLSLSALNTPEEVDHIISVLPGIIEKLRGMSPVWQRLEQGAK